MHLLSEIVSFYQFIGVYKVLFEVSSVKYCIVNEGTSKASKAYLQQRADIDFQHILNKKGHLATLRES